MPQEVALFPEFTIKETLIYFSLIHNINDSEAELTIKQLLENFDLTQNDKSIEVLSDDHKRLVSLAISFIHRPKLLVLDEPTVAVDSEIRALIWGKMAQMCKELGETNSLLILLLK